LSRIPEAPWEIVCADFVGPLPRSRHGNTILLVFVDKFSKWVELIPLRKATSTSLQNAFRERIMARFGAPKIFICDNGTQFTSNTFKKYLQDLGIRQQFTAPYTPQENPTERMNRTVKTMIAQYADNDQRSWDELLPEIMLAVNTSVSETTGYTPTYLVQGKEPRLPNTLFNEVTIGTGALNEAPAEKEERLHTVFGIVRNNMARCSVEQARHYNLRRREWHPPVGTLVWLKQHHLSKAVDSFAAKLAPKFDGPYLIKSYQSPVIVRLKKADEKKLRSAHITDLKAFMNYIIRLLSENHKIIK